eukprot:1159057-Pelagomonas_calceolata.AAC.1
MCELAIRLAACTQAGMSYKPRSKKPLANLTGSLHTGTSSLNECFYSPQGVRASVEQNPSVMRQTACTRAHVSSIHCTNAVILRKVSGQA